MKKFKLYSLSALALMLSTTSCSDDFLSVDPPALTYRRILYNRGTYHGIGHDGLRSEQWYDYFGGWAPLALYGTPWEMTST